MEAPYQVSVRLVQRENGKYGSGHICGGVVITQRLIVSAAHCTFAPKKKGFRRAREYVLIMGSTFLSKKDTTTLQYNVQMVVNHPSYDHETYINDITLFFINGYIPWNSEVTALPLSTRQYSVGTKCVVSGWGSQETGGSRSNSLQAAEIPIISRAECIRSYGNIPVTQICAGYMHGGTDSCQGDSGGPLQCHNTLVGIVSYGGKCAEKDYPGVYTNVIKYTNWIYRINNSFDYSIYKNGSLQLTVWPTILAVFILASY
ncbi:GH24378 [Drosophila grimshawi]|uniref:GH24378 n=2 Tax=Drosophila grimshawi TaxID=7222 RepID=B4JM84_DROGR|nr:GH24378 [Drosophila grimshawi]